ncbi:hypothetical protein JCM16418_818 [Paenibacillus pini JCM 16418]|uniref:Lysozyme n=1 Tax=Paenibacillus pini JCM 16418 TaxID=1236976 RepID=W7Y7C0_9BACL|nr:hypothetical protein JCM16418_818 [Paenibacillus pini JCM 16418]
MKPVVYTYPSFIGNFTGLSEYPLWIARYNAAVPPDNASGWTRWAFFQYSDGSAGGGLPSGTRRVSGISGPVDLNEFDGTIEQLKERYKKKKEPQKEGTNMDKKDANAIIEKYLKPAWGAATIPSDKKEIGRLADQLRAASGQPRQNV